MPHSNPPSTRARRIVKCLAMLDAEGQERDTALTQLFKFIKADNGKFSDYFFFNLHTGDIQKPPVADEQELGGLRQLVDNNRDRILEARKYLATKDAESSLLTMQIDALRRDKEKLEDQAYSAQCAYYDQLNKKRPTHPRDNNKTIGSKSQHNSKVQRQKRDADDNPFPKSSLPNNGDIPNFGDKNPNWKNIIRTLDRGGETAKQQLAAWLLELKAHGYRITDVLITKESEYRNKKYLEMWRTIGVLHNNMETILNEGLELDYKIRCIDERLINLIDDRDAITNDISSLHSQINYYNAKIKPANNNPSASKPSAAGAAGSQRPTASSPAPTNPSTTSSPIPPAAASQQAGSPQTHGPATPASSSVMGSRQTSSIPHPGTSTGAWKAHAKQGLGQVNTPPPPSTSAPQPPVTGSPQANPGNPIPHPGASTGSWRAMPSKGTVEPKRLLLLHLQLLRPQEDPASILREPFVQALRQRQAQQEVLLKRKGHLRPRASHPAGHRKPLPQLHLRQRRVRNQHLAQPPLLHRPNQEVRHQLHLRRCRLCLPLHNKHHSLRPHMLSCRRVQLCRERDLKLRLERCWRLP